MLITSASCTRQCVQVNSGTFLILYSAEASTLVADTSELSLAERGPSAGDRGLFVRRGQRSPPSDRAIGDRTSWAETPLMVQTSRSWTSAVCAKRCRAHGKPCADGEFTGTGEIRRSGKMARWKQEWTAEEIEKPRTAGTTPLSSLSYRTGAALGLCGSYGARN